MWTACIFWVAYQRTHSRWKESDDVWSTHYTSRSRCLKITLSSTKQHSIYGSLLLGNHSVQMPVWSVFRWIGLKGALSSSQETRAGTAGSFSPLSCCLYFYPSLILFPPSTLLTIRITFLGGWLGTSLSAFLFFVSARIPTFFHLIELLTWIRQKAKASEQRSGKCLSTSGGQVVCGIRCHHLLSSC